MKHAPPLALTTDALHLYGDGRAAVVPAFRHDYEDYMRAFCTQEDPGRLVTIHRTDAPWRNWERHPGGEELVVVLRGRARFFQEIDGETVVVDVGPGEAVVNPAGVFHTADPLEPFDALYVTPGPGTTHRPRAGG